MMDTRLYRFDTPDLFLDYKHNDPDTFSQFSMHVHNLYELDYIVSGRGSYYVEGAEYPIFSGCILLIHPIDAHMTHVDIDSTYERVTIQFSAEILSEIDPSGVLNEFIQSLPAPQIAPPSETEGFFKQLFTGIRTLNGETASYQRQSILAILSTALFSLRRLLQISENANVSMGVSVSDTIRNVIVFINQHLTEDLSLDHLCKQFNISKSYMNKRFKEITGTTLWDYVLIKRLTIARQKIHSGMSIQEAFRNSGFGDYSNFYRCYVKRFGISPKEDAAQDRRTVIIS